MDSKRDKGVEIPPWVLDDLCCRFLLHVPSEERDDAVRLCFQVELAHWFYQDFYVDQNNNNTPPAEGDPHPPCPLPQCGIQNFIRAVFRHCPFLLPPGQAVQDVIQRWFEYKQGIPVYGAIILDPTLEHVLLVQGYGNDWWAFPGGKVNQDETPRDCATREVLEETGFDVTGRMSQNVYIESKLPLSGRLFRYYLVPGVSRNTRFKPRTRNEIRDVRWFPVEQLPSCQSDIRTTKLGGRNRFSMVSPFIQRLKEEWIPRLEACRSAWERKGGRRDPPVQTLSMGPVALTHFSERPGH